MLKDKIDYVQIINSSVSAQIINKQTKKKHIRRLQDSHVSTVTIITL